MGMSVLFDYDLSEAVDQKSYWGMAHGDFNTSPHRKYRFIIPLLAAAVNRIIQTVAHLFNRDALSGDFSMKASFYLVNLTVCALWCTLIWKFCRAYGQSWLGALFGLLTVTTSRWTAVHTGTPHVDLLYCLAIACTLYGIRARSSEFLYAAIFLGPFSKELYIFVAPVLLFSHWPKWKTILWILVAGILVFVSRFVIDAITQQPVSRSLEAGLHIFSYIPSQVARLKITGYWIELFATLGLWWVMPLAAKLLVEKLPRIRRFVREPYIIAFLLSAAWQLVFHGEYARMSYILMPVYAVVVGFSAELLYGYWRSQRAGTAPNDAPDSAAPGAGRL